MKSGSYRIIPSVTVFTLLFLGAIHLSAVTLTNSPSVTSNTYPGNITLDIGGLGAGEAVTVQKWLDLNANGVIDPGEPMIDAFGASDGGAMIIGGITNISVPFDSNPASGAITATLNFAPPMTLENIVGHYVYRVVSPTGNFSPVTATFIVTNAATAQSLTGTVYSNGVAPLPYAVVVALPPNGNGYAGATVADANGHYSLNLNPGDYAVTAGLPGYFCDQSLAPQLTLTNGMTATNDLSLTNGTVSITGRFYNTSNSNGVGGLAVQVQSHNLFAIAFTDTNGVYTAGVSPNLWTIKPIKERLARRAFVTDQNGLQVDATSGNVTNANLPLYKGTALYYGRITLNGAPLANIRIDSDDGTNVYASLGYTDTNGYYAVVALGGVSSNWSAQANDSDNPIFTTFVVNTPASTNITVGQALLVNFICLPVTAHITGQVLDNFGNPVSDVALYANALISGNNYSSQNVDTDNSGNYSLGVTSGTWGVSFSIGGKNGLDSHGDVDYFQPHLVSIPPTNIVLNLTVYQNGTPVMSFPQRFSATQFGFNINGAQNGSYDVQLSTNLVAGSGWNPLVSLTLTNVPFLFVDSHATNSQRFYRVKKN